MDAESLPGHVGKSEQVSGWFRIALCGLLVGAGLLTSVIGNLASPRSMPDERHHYAMIKYAAEQGWFFDYGEIRTDPAAVPNHLAHPPLYYWLLGQVYRVLEPDRHFTQIGREHDRYGSPESHQVVMPVLRGLSHWLLFLGLFGVYRLIMFLIRLGWLSRSTALVFVVGVAYIPGFRYIGAGLNNDVLALVLWPFLTQATLTWMIHRHAAAWWQVLGLSALAVLSKATLWMLVLVFGLISLAGLFRHLRERGDSKLTSSLAEFWSGIRCKCWCVFALIMLSLAVIHLMGNLLQYGSPQPIYHDIYEIATEDSKFYLGNESRDFPENWYHVGPRVWLTLSQTTLGFVGHTERVVKKQSARGPAALLMCLLLGTGLVLWQADRRDDPRFWMWLMCSLPWLLQFALLWYVNVDFYKDFNRIAAEGRYLIGYLQLAILGVAIVATRPSIMPRLNRPLAWLSLTGFAVLLCRPTVYLDQTWEFVRRSSMVAVIDKQLRENDYRPIPWAGIKATNGQALLVARKKSGVPKHMRLTGQQFNFAMDRGKPENVTRLEMVLWVQAGTLTDTAIELLENRDIPSLSQSAGPVLALSLGEEMETYSLTFPVAGLRIGDKPSLELRTQRNETLQVFGCFYRWQ